jgi:ribosomal protein L21E
MTQTGTVVDEEPASFMIEIKEENRESRPR